MNEPNTRMDPCRLCGRATLYDDLTMFGARCQACFDAYCKAIPAAPKVAAHSMPVADTHPLAWAHRLRIRETAGEPLSRHARDAWREVLPKTEAE
jgi:hypothetical protein